MEEKWFLIEYEVDTGHDYVRDEVLIKANDEKDIRGILIEHIKSINHNYNVNEIFGIKEFKDKIFTGKFEFKGKKKIEDESVCGNCNGTGFVSLGPGIRGIKSCEFCHGTGKNNRGGNKNG